MKMHSSITGSGMNSERNIAPNGPVGSGHVKVGCVGKQTGNEALPDVVSFRRSRRSHQNNARRAFFHHLVPAESNKSNEDAKFLVFQTGKSSTNLFYFASYLTTVLIRTLIKLLTLKRPQRGTPPQQVIDCVKFI